MKNKILVLCSGGMDSAVVLYKAAEVKDIEEIHVLTYDYNQQHAREIQSTYKQIESLKAKHKNGIDIIHNVIDLSFIANIGKSALLPNNTDIPVDKSTPITYVPMRNLMFLSIAAAYAESNNIRQIWYGAVKADNENGYWDCSSEFRQKLNSIFALNKDSDILINTPLINYTKADIIKEGVTLGVNFKDTYTCYSGEELPTYNSASSKLRVEGFIEAGYRDPIQYKEQNELNKLYKEKNCKSLS